MTREEAQKATTENENYRPLSISTMALCDRTDNKALKRILSPDDGGIVADMYSLLEFLYIHYKGHALSDIATAIREGTLEDKALAWGDSADPMVIQDGVDYFTNAKKS